MASKTIEHVPDEHTEQKNVINWAELMSNRHPELKLIFAIPNGGNRNIVTAVRLKAEGVRAGVPDLFLPVPRPSFMGGKLAGRYQMGLWIEMKKRKGSTTSKEQHWWHEKLRDQGYRVEVCKGAEEAIKVISDYLGIEQ